MIGAIAPVAGFRRLLEGAMMRAESSPAMLLSEDYADSNVLSWWRRGYPTSTTSLSQPLAHPLLEGTRGPV